MNAASTAHVAWSLIQSIIAAQLLYGLFTGKHLSPPSLTSPWFDGSVNDVLQWRPLAWTSRAFDAAYQVSEYRILPARVTSLRGAYERQRKCHDVILLEWRCKICAVRRRANLKKAPLGGGTVAGRVAVSHRLRVLWPCIRDSSDSGDRGRCCQNVFHRYLIDFWKTRHIKWNVRLLF